MTHHFLNQEDNREGIKDRCALEKTLKLTECFPKVQEGFYFWNPTIKRKWVKLFQMLRLNHVHAAMIYEYVRVCPLICERTVESLDV